MLSIAPVASEAALAQFRATIAEQSAEIAELRRHLEKTALPVVQARSQRRVHSRRRAAVRIGTTAREDRAGSVRCHFVASSLAPPSGEECQGLVNELNRLPSYLYTQVSDVVRFVYLHTGRA